MFNKTNKYLSFINSIKISILLSVLTLSLLYIWYWELNNYIYKVAKSSYSRWLETALWEIMKRWIDKSCKPINISDDKNGVNLINIECLKTQSQDNNSTTEENIKTENIIKQK